jgi:cytochrome c556
MRHVPLLISALLTATLATVASAQVKPEKAIEYRQGAMTVIGWHFGAMAAMVKGEKPYDKEDFARRAAIVEVVAKIPMEGFTPDSDKGHTKAKPEIWSKMDDFKAKMEKMQSESSKLAAVSKSGSMDDIKKQFGATGGTCKSCHDDYRSK